MGVATLHVRADVTNSNMPVSSKVAVSLCALGVVGSLFIGYCVYFDRKRRSHPDYKKKVRERKLTLLFQEHVQFKILCPAISVLFISCQTKVSYDVVQLQYVSSQLTLEQSNQCNGG